MYGASKSLLDWVGTIEEREFEFVFLVPYAKGNLKTELEKLDERVIQLRYYQLVVKFNNRGVLTRIKNIVRILLCFIFNPMACNKLLKFCKREKVDLIHSNCFAVSLGAETAIKINLPHIWHIREFMEEDHMMRYMYNIKRLRRLEEFSYPIYISKSIQKKYAEIFNNMGSVIYNTVAYDKDYVKTRTFLQNGECNIIIVGKITQNKGQLEAVKAVEYLRKNDIQVSLHICGEGPDESILKNYVEDNKLEKFVHFLGFRNDVINIRKNMDIALMCSVSEAFGRVTVEAAYYENLVVGLKTAGTEEIINHMKTGILYRKNDFVSLADSIKKAMQFPENSKRMIDEAKLSSISKFGRSIYPEICDIYSKMFIGR